jgi:hypothetical protein
MTTKDKIKALGGIIDFGAAGSMPWAIYPNGELATSSEYNEATQIRSQDKSLQPVQIISASKYRGSKWLVVRSYKLFGITVYKKYHKGVLYKFI